MTDNFTLFGDYKGWKLYLPALFSGFFILLALLMLFRPKSKILTAIQKHPLWFIIGLLSALAIIICWVWECNFTTYLGWIAKIVLFCIFPTILWKVIQLVVRR